MTKQSFPVIDPVATGENILRLRKERGLTVRDLQAYFGFEQPQAIYKWQYGKSLPSVDNLYALSSLLEVPMNDILVPAKPQLNIVREQQAIACCSLSFWQPVLNAAKVRRCFHPLSSGSVSPSKGRYSGSTWNAPQSGAMFLS